MTSTVVYSRLIAENFKQARGLAFTLMNCAPGFIAIGGIPLLNWEILRFGWRDAYVSFGAFVLVCGLIAVALIPNHKMSRSAFESQENEPAAPPVSKTRQSAKAEFRAILLRPVFWVIVAAIFLITLQTPLHAVQMNIMLFDQVKSTQIAANMASIYVFGTITGRLSCGLALDRYSTPGVSTLSMVLPAIGFFLLALSLHSIPVVVFSMFLVGVSVGAENDLCPFLVARYFRLDNYSFTLSLIQGTSLIAAATGAAATSLTLKLANSYVPYLYIISFTTLIGSMLFLFLPGLPEGSIANSDSKSDA
jgi:MFS family permease